MDAGVESGNGLTELFDGVQGIMRDGVPGDERVPAIRRRALRSV